MAVLLVVFNRPQHTERVVARLRACAPNRLYVASDGPRDTEGDRMLVNQVRAIIAGIDWPCRVITRYENENKGCKYAVSGAISWFFEHETEGLILEDDCLPSQDLLMFASKMLELYRDDTRIGVVCGTALGNLREIGVAEGGNDIVFSRFPSVWGWATWRRFWKNYDAEMKSWPNVREHIAGGFNNNRMGRLSTSLLQRTYQGDIDTWDYQLSYTLWSQNQLAVIPRMNLVENIGFGSLATHTKVAGHPLASLSKVGNERLAFPLSIPSLVLPNTRYEAYLKRIAIPGALTEIINKMKTLWSQIRFA